MPQMWGVLRERKSWSKGILTCEKHAIRRWEKSYILSPSGKTDTLLSEGWKFSPHEPSPRHDLTLLGALPYTLYWGKHTPTTTCWTYQVWCAQFNTISHIVEINSLTTDEIELNLLQILNLCSLWSNQRIIYCLGGVDGDSFAYLFQGTSTSFSNFKWTEFFLWCYDRGSMVYITWIR